MVALGSDGVVALSPRIGARTGIALPAASTADAALSSRVDLVSGAIA